MAHLDANGAPRISVYANDTSDSGAGKGRVTVRHDAAVGPVDVFAGGTKVISALANPNQAKLDVPATSIPIRVALTNGGTTVFNSPVVFAGERQHDHLRDLGQERELQSPDPEAADRVAAGREAHPQGPGAKRPGPFAARALCRPG